jgi:uncharacterized protein
MSVTLSIGRTFLAERHCRSHRLWMEVSSSNFPRFDRNLNTGGKNYDETKWRSAKNTIHHDGTYASRLILPIVR